MTQLTMFVLSATLFLAPVTHSASASIRMEAVYSQGADIFDLMDNVSEWWEGFCDAEYKKYWKEKYGISKEDSEFFSKYAALREKYYSDPDQAEKDPLKNRNGFFAMTGTITADPLAEAFYDSDSLEQGYAKAAKVITADELSFLKSFHAYFAPKYAPLLKESAAFKKIMPSVNRSLRKPGMAGYFGEVARFYNVKSDLSYRVLYTWWPPIKRTNASPTGRYLIMRYNPVQHIDIAETDWDIAFHEVVHAISAMQPLEQKQQITQAFIKICDPRESVKRGRILEEPLAVALGQIEFLRRFAPKKLVYDDSLYIDPWVNLLGKLIHPVLEKSLREKKNIQQGFAESAARLCREVLAASDYLKK